MLIRIITAIVFALALSAGHRANAASGCPLPFTLLNGVIPDAAQVMADLNALQSCTTGSASGGGGGNLLNLSLTVPPEFAVTGSPYTGGSGVFAMTKTAQNPHTVWAGPVSGTPQPPAFRQLSCSDLAGGCITSIPNLIIPPSGDTTGATDTQAIAAALALCNGTNTVMLATGKFYIQSPGLTPPANCVLWIGLGSNTIPDGGSGSITGAQLVGVGSWAASGNSGPAVLNIVHNRVTVIHGQVQGLGTCWGGPGVDAIGMHNTVGSILEDVSTFHGQIGINMLADNLSGVGDQGFSQINEIRFGSDFGNCSWGIQITQLNSGNNSDSRILMRNYGLDGNAVAGGTGNLLIQRAATFQVIAGGFNEDTFPTNDAAILIDSCSYCQVFGTQMDLTGGENIRVKNSTHTQIDGVKLARAHWNGSTYAGPYIVLDGNNFDVNITNYIADRCVFQVANYTGGTEDQGVYDIYPNQNGVYCDDTTEGALAPFSRNNVSHAWSVLALSGSTFPGYDIFLAPYFKFPLVHGTCNPCTISNPITINGGNLSTTLAGVTSAQGVFDIGQSATGGDTVSWGSAFVGTPTLNLAANAHTIVPWQLSVDGKFHLGAAE